MMVVSEIGEMWSPHTAPAMQAEMEMIRSGSPMGNTAMQMGMRMPKVPHDVPVAKARNIATTKMMAGSRSCSVPALSLTSPATYSAAPSESVMDFSDHARQSISIAGTIASNPLMRHDMASLKASTRRLTYQMMLSMSDVMEPITRPTEASEEAKALTKSM